MKKIIFACAFMFVAAGCAKTSTTPVPTPAPIPSQLPSAEQTPPGAYEYTSGTYGFTVRYPLDFGLATTREQVQPQSYIPVCDETMAACLYYKGTGYVGTNFEGAAVSINVLSDKKTAAECQKLLGETSEIQTETGTKVMNGITYYGGVGGGAGAGHFMDTVAYRAFVSNRCYELAGRIASTNIGNYEPGTIKEFDPGKVRSQLEEVVSSVNFTK
jgi:hypothetical protein